MTTIHKTGAALVLSTCIAVLGAAGCAMESGAPDEGADQSPTVAPERATAEQAQPITADAPKNDESVGSTEQGCCGLGFGGLGYGGFGYGGLGYAGLGYGAVGYGAGLGYGGLGYGGLGYGGLGYGGMWGW